MSKPLNEFGGWLSFFQIIHWIWFMASLIALIISVSLAFLTSLINVSLVNILYIFPFSLIFFVVFYFISRIFKIVEKKSIDVPDRIVRYWFLQMLMLLLMDILGYIVVYFIKELKFSMSLRYSLLRFGAFILWYFLWILYFQNSRRVREYYGKNADGFV